MEIGTSAATEAEAQSRLTQLEAELLPEGCQPAAPYGALLRARVDEAPDLFQQMEQRAESLLRHGKRT